jgi:uncharacterized oxidoreductase
VLATDANEIIVAGAKPQRGNPGPAEHGFVDAFNAQMPALVSGSKPRAQQ